MKCILFALMLCASISGYSQSSPPAIDSLRENIQPDPGVTRMEIKLFANIYVSDTTGIDSIQVMLGDQSGSSDILTQAFATGSVSFLQDMTTGSLYFNIPLGHQALVPPYLQAYLISNSRSNSATLQKQLVF
jgi:hypothetical protein